jgi:hypothetical protein
VSQADKYLSSRDPQGFPWLSPTSSNPHILAPVALCARSTGYTLPVSLAAFRALHAGSAIPTARLSRPWRAFKGGPHSYRSTVTVHH